MKAFSNKIIGGLAHEMVITISVYDEPWNHCPAKHQGGWHMMNFTVSVCVIIVGLIMNRGTIFHKL